MERCWTKLSFNPAGGIFRHVYQLTLARCVTAGIFFSLKVAWSSNLSMFVVCMCVHDNVVCVLIILTVRHLDLSSSKSFFFYIGTVGVPHLA